MEVTRIFDILTNLKEIYPREDSLVGKVDRKWVKYSSAEYYELSHYFSNGLLATGLKSGDKVLTISNNRPEWNIMDMGMSQTGIIHVPIYPTLSDTEFGYIFKHSEAKAIIVSDKALYNKVKDVVAKTSNITTSQRFR